MRPFLGKIDLPLHFFSHYLILNSKDKSIIKNLFKTIHFRVATFNDCEEAAAELQKQITEAREDLRDKGFKFQE